MINSKVNRLLYCLCISVVIAGCSDNDRQKIAVAKVIDGDSIVDQHNNRFHLAYIDAPEREQPFGLQAKNFLKQKVANEDVEFVVTDNDTVEIMLDGHSVNLSMVQLGYAWASPDNPDPSKALQYKEAQQLAVEELQGLWSLGHGLMVAPWQWRQQATQVLPSMNNRQRINQQREAEQRLRAQRIEQQRLNKQRKLQQQVPVEMEKKVEGK